jgi:protein TonB
MRTSAAAQQLSEHEVYSADEIARAAGVPAPRVARLLPNGRYADRAEAIRLVRRLTPVAVRRGDKLPLTVLASKPRSQGLPLFVSTTLHVAFVAVLVLLGSGLFASPETEQVIPELKPTRLVFIMALGPGGGGGGGGMKVDLPPARAERKAPPKARKINSPVPAVKKTPAPPPRVDPPKPPEPPKIDPPKIDPPKIEPPKQEPPRVEPPKAPEQAIQAPVVPSPADQVNKPGVLNQPPAVIASAGPGNGGGVGTGRGAGIGDGRGGGIGPGTGGGTGGGPFQPGAGISPPSLVREVTPLYTDEGRRRSIEGDVVLEVVVRSDGSVGNVRVLRRLGAGLDERAIEAVRQWRFSPARRQGAAVDVVVEVSVDFRLR